MIINSNKQPKRQGTAPLSRVSRLAVMALGLSLVVLTPSEASAQGVFFTKANVLKSFFARSERVGYKRHVLNAAQQRTLQQHLGYTPAAKWPLYHGTTAGRVDGYAIIDNEMGQHEPITFAVLIDPHGTLKRVEIMVYREGHGEEVRQARFRRQFKGKSVSDPLRHGADIIAISGATISSKAIASGARRAVAVVHELVVRPARDQAAATMPRRQ